MNNSKYNELRSQRESLNQKINDLLPRHKRYRIHPDLKLSDAAKNEPLRSSALKVLRDIILRENAFNAIDPVPFEMTVIEPPVGLIIPGTEITIRSLGWGKLSVEEGAAFACKAHGCGVNDLTQNIDPTDQGCGTNSCGDQLCNELSCEDNVCKDQVCGTLDCTKNSDQQQVALDLQSEISHPFVRELFDFFGAGDLRDVTEEILNYAAFGAVGTSLYTKSK